MEFFEVIKWLFLALAVAVMIFKLFWNSSSKILGVAPMKFFSIYLQGEFFMTGSRKKRKFMVVSNWLVIVFWVSVFFHLFLWLLLW